MNLIIVIIIGTSTFLSAHYCHAQDFDQIEAQKIALVTKELQLTPTEAEMFFPLYTQYKKEISNLRNERKKRPNGEIRPENRDVLAFDAKELQLKKIYRTHFAAVIGKTRAYRFFEVEEEFMIYLLRKLQKQ